MADRVLVLTAAAGVPDAAVAAVRAALAAAADPEPPRRLADTAVDIPLRTPPPGGFAVAGCDANVVATAGRRKRLLIADMDSTIIGVECIDELADFAGLKVEVAGITEAAMRGELDFEAALVARVALLKGLPAAVLERCHAERVRLNPGARTLARTMTALGARTALVSGGFSFFSERVAAEAGFACHQANRLVVADGLLTGEVERPILGREAKLAALQRLSAGTGAGAAIAVGDGANDVDMVLAAGLGVAYRAKPVLAEAADARLEVSDLTALLALQGIPAAEWVA